MSEWRMGVTAIGCHCGVNKLMSGTFSCVNHCDILLELVS
jgi:hypothetical protein